MSAAWPWAQLCAHSLWGSSGPLPLSGLGVLIWRSVGLVLTQPAVLASQSCLPGTRATGCQPAPQPPWPHCSRSSAECASREKPCWAPQTHALWVPVSVGVVGESPGVACPPADLGPNCPPLLTFAPAPGLLPCWPLAPSRVHAPRHPGLPSARPGGFASCPDGQTPGRVLAGPLLRSRPRACRPAPPRRPLLLLSPARPPLSRPLHPYTRRTHAESAHSLPPAATANGPCHLPAIVSASITRHRPPPPPVCQMLRACRGQSERPAPQPPELSRRGADQLQLGAELSNAVAEPRGRRRCPAWVGGAVSGGKPVS